MAEINNGTQLSVFSTIVTILRNDATLAAAFPTSHFYEDEPKAKSSSFTGFPYMVIHIPTTETDLLVFDNSVTLKDFGITIEMVEDYTARSNVTTHANKVIRQIESSEATLQAIGYYNPRCEVVARELELINQKDVITVTFDVITKGYVGR